MSINMFKKRIKKSRAKWLGLLLRKGNSRSRSRQQHSERGIAIPLVIGIGLLMMLLSITVIVRSQSSQVNTSNLKQAVTASEVAETGVATIQALFNQYRQLPRFTLANIDTTSATKVTTWTRAAGIFPATCGGTASTDSNYLKSILKKDATTTPVIPGWVNIDSTRRFRVISYTYIPNPTGTTAVTTPAAITAFDIPASTNKYAETVSTAVTVTTSPYLTTTGSSVYGQIAGMPGTLTKTSTGYTFKAAIAPSSAAVNTSGQSFYPISNGGANVDSGVGSLEIEGQVVSNTSAANPSEFSRAGLQVAIPVTPGSVNNVPIPGTWLGTRFALSGGQTFAADALVPCNTAATVPQETRTPPYTASPTELSIPPVPEASEYAYTFSSDITSATTLPIASGLPVTSGYNPITRGYEYKVTNITLANGADTLTINPNYKVSIYLSGNIKVSGQADILHSTNILHPIGNAHVGLPLLNVSPPSTDVTLTGATITGTTTTGSGNNAVTTITSSVPTTAPITLSNDSGIPVISSNSDYLTTNGSFVYGTLGTSGIPGKLTKIAAVTTGNPAGYTFTPTTTPTPTTPSITVASGSMFTPQKSSYKAVDFKIYGSNTASITGANPPHICLSGNSKIGAFILAPNYQFGMAGGGNSGSTEATTPGIEGSVWAGLYPSTIAGCSSSSNKIVVTQNSTWDDVGLAPVNLPPSTQSIQTWNKKEVN